MGAGWAPRGDPAGAGAPPHEEQVVAGMGAELGASNGHVEVAWCLFCFRAMGSGIFKDIHATVLIKRDLHAHTRTRLCVHAITLLFL